MCLTGVTLRIARDNVRGHLPDALDRDHRGHGYGRAICVAAAAALQELGSSSAIVRTPSSDVGAVATYRSAGFQQLPAVRDRRRDT